jgi:hypothetical protein
MSILDKLKGWLGGPTAPGAPPPAGATPPAALETRALVTEEPEAPGDTEQAASAATHDDEGSDGPEATEEPGRAPRWTAEDDARLEAEARALIAAGDAAGALARLGQRGLMLARHEVGSLPCLCRRCATPEGRSAEHAGVAFVRDFVVARRRVLLYWAPAELSGDAKQVRASMRAAIVDRLRAPAVHATEPRPGINPFTKEPMVIQPKRARLRENPLAGLQALAADSGARRSGKPVP